MVTVFQELEEVHALSLDLAGQSMVPGLSPNIKAFITILDTVSLVQTLNFLI